MNWFSSFVLRKAGWIALLGTLFGVWGAYYSVALYKNLRTEIQELLPTSARSVIDLKDVSNRLESIDSLAILIFSKNPGASKRFVNDLVKKLDQVPKTTLASVDYKIDLEIQFFRDRQALFIDLEDLRLISRYIRDRIEYEKSLYNPLLIFDDNDLIEPELDFLKLKKKYSGKTASYDHLPSGFYATRDEFKRVILANLPGSAGGIENAHRLKSAVIHAITSLNPQSYAADLEIKYSGGVEDTIEEQEALVADLELSTAIVMVVVTFGMLMFYRTARATFALLGSLLIGTLWTFGISYFAVGYLNANSAFLGSIVIGNGINFGIIFLARYLEERRKNHGNTRAIRISMIHTATSTWTAALAAGLSYGSLILTGFRGFKQFGLIGLFGMVLCWLSAFTLLPAYLTILDQHQSLIKPQTLSQRRKSFTQGISYLVNRFAGSIFMVSTAVTFFSIFTLFKLTPGILETDLSKLRNKASLESGSASLWVHLDEIFQRNLLPLVILPKSEANAQKIAQRLKEKKQKEGDASPLTTIQTLSDFIPTDQLRKIAVIKEIQKLLPPRLLQRLSPTDQKRVADFLNPNTLVPFGMKDLPPMVLRKFTEKDGSIGKLVLVEPPSIRVTGHSEELVRFMRELRAVADSVEPGAAVAGTLAISADMIEAVTRDGPRATLFALIAVVILVILLFRNVKTIALVLFALFLGVLWLAGIMIHFDLKVNLINFIALPITFGIGVDYGVNIFQRYRESKNPDILEVIRSTGSAVGLCSFSTIVGYMSLLLAGNQGFVSFGLLAVLGELTCVVAAIISLPAYLMYRNRKAQT